MSLKKIFYPESKFGGFSDIDGTIAFYFRVNSLIQSSFTVLDIGCGRGEYADDPIKIKKDLRVLRGKVKKVIGIDIDERARTNPFIDEFHLINNKKWSVEDNSIDLIISDFVLEHIDNPDNFFSEINRVLKKGGYVCLRTPNSWSYVALFSKFIPNKHHAKVLEKVQNSRKEEDVFPTYYHCNSKRKIRSILKTYSFDSVVYGYEGEPDYLTFSKLAYALGVVHQKFAPNFLKPTLFAFAQKNNS